MFIKRNISAIISRGAKQIPVIAIIGPRQSGKSTLAKKLFPQHTYIDMQDAQIFEFANTDPKGFLKTYNNEHGIILDEAQYAPNLFPQIKVEADRDPRPGRFILSGSQNFLLYEKISESLAGRVYFYTLLPLSIQELIQADLLVNQVKNQLIKGFYPKVYHSGIIAHEYYENYISTYVERDIRTLKNIENILIFKKFMRLCALRIGSPLNLTDLAMHCGIAVQTAKNWLSLLEASFILFFLAPYHGNLGKRITKSPKLYFYDVGLALSMLGISKEMLIKRRDLYGAMFENMIIVDIIKNFYTTTQRPSFSFFRDSNQNEVDLIIEHGDKTIPIEIKASETIDRHSFDTPTWFVQQMATHEKPIIIYGGNQSQQRTKGRVLSWKNSARIMKEK